MSDSWHSYPSIFALGHKAVTELFLDSVVVQEKIDGSQFSMGRFDGELRCRSKGAQLVVDAPEKMFALAVETAASLDLRDGWTYRCEYLQKPKHNTLCLDPSTRILAADMTWPMIGDVQPGARVVGFDEWLPGRKRQRRLRIAEVTKTWRRVSDDVYRIVLHDGREVIATGDHQWLCLAQGSPAHHWWKETRLLVVGSRIRNVMLPAQPSLTYRAGYLAAAFDGEASLHLSRQGASSGAQLVFVQRDNAMLARVLEFLRADGFAPKGPYTKSSSSAKAVGLYSTDSVMRFLSLYRPVRLVGWEAMWADRVLPRTGQATVVACERLTACYDVVDISTTSGTFVAEGLASHNCYDRVPEKHLILFDVNPGHEEYLGPLVLAAEGSRLGLEVVPLLRWGPVGSMEEITGFLETTSILGGQKIEGIVVKNYARFGLDKKALMGKYVSEKYKEVHAREWKLGNPKAGDIVAQMIDRYRTPARWQKAIQHLAERGGIEGSPRDIGPLIREVPEDVERECADEIREALWLWAWPKIRRGLNAGLPEWYKSSLAEQAFPAAVPAGNETDAPS